MLILYPLKMQVTGEFDVSQRNEIIDRLAEEYEAILVPLDVAFEEAVTKRPSCQWTTSDGFHPNPVGHTLIALNFLETLRW